MKTLSDLPRLIPTIYLLDRPSAAARNPPVPDQSNTSDVVGKNYLLSDLSLLFSTVSQSVRSLGSQRLLTSPPPYSTKQSSTHSIHNGLASGEIPLAAQTELPNSPLALSADAPTTLSSASVSDRSSWASSAAFEQNNPRFHVHPSVFFPLPDVYGAEDPIFLPEERCLSKYKYIYAARSKQPMQRSVAKKGSIWLTTQRLIFVPTCMNTTGWSVLLSTVLSLNLAQNTVVMTCTDSLYVTAFIDSGTTRLQFARRCSNMKLSFSISMHLPFEHDHITAPTLPTYEQSDAALQRYLALRESRPPPNETLELTVLERLVFLDYGADGIVVSNIPPAAQRIYDAHYYQYSVLPGLSSEDLGLTEQGIDSINSHSASSTDISTSSSSDVSV
ncbi:hypothetical protein CANCADRAFT_1641 [Tortispora caseinolytica NRRL Y-17796]|uniref:Uncharacterized protein n=1 Tax=Tortispora caseinolytica NRRL Y-17796 TaxID=767744 RepID=A0A1E4TE21_9ASCO|nr:hypothetical protein CANCADRAFT_1641 [Tortispora caseinolytica NRRL Y-17796]